MPYPYNYQQRCHLMACKSQAEKIAQLVKMTEEDLDLGVDSLLDIYGDFYKKVKRIVGGD